MNYNPSGIQFFDAASEREMLLVQEGHAAGWLCYRHLDGHWVALRKATDEDLARIALPMVRAGDMCRIVWELIE